jgi:hypothetical protein
MKLISLIQCKSSQIKQLEEILEKLSDESSQPDTQRRNNKEEKGYCYEAQQNRNFLRVFNDLTNQISRNVAQVSCLLNIISWVEGNVISRIFRRKFPCNKRRFSLTTSLNAKLLFFNFLAKASIAHVLDKDVSNQFKVRSQYLSRQWI